MSTGRAIVFTGPRTFEERTYPVPEPGPGELVVEPVAVTVCGSDVHTWEGRRPYPTPAILGHEIVGRIAATGDDAPTDTGGESLAVGDRITWTIMANCGTCRPCRVRGLPQKCEALFKYGHAGCAEPPHFTGGFAEYVHVRAGTCTYAVPAVLDDAVAAPLMCGAATVAGGVDTVGIEPGDAVVIQGAGYLGLFASCVVRHLGAGDVVLLDVDAERLALAKSFGADHVLDAGAVTDDELVARVEELTDGRGADLVVEVTGNPDVIPVGIDMLAVGGRYLLHGTVMPDATVSIDAYDLVSKHLTVSGVHNYDATHLRTAIEIAAAAVDTYPFDRLVGDGYPLTVDGVTDAFRAQANRASVRPVVRP